ncbi:MAG: TolC family protein [Bacteroidota bacterium]
MKRAFLLLVVIFTIGSQVFAQEATPGVRPLTLPECVDIALKNNLNVRRSIYNVETYNVNLFTAKMNFLPSINAGGSYGLNYGRSLNPVTNTYINRNGSSVNGQLTGSWLLFNGFRVTNTFRQGKKDVAAADADLQKAKNDVIINVVTLYINVIFNKELLANNQYQLGSSQQQLDRITRQVEAGALPKSNQLTQEAQVATNEVNVINQENALRLSVLQLKQAMQIPASEQMDVVVPEIALEDIILDTTPEQIYAESLKTMPEIKSALLKVESARLALMAAKGGLYPRLTLNGSAFSNYSSISRDQNNSGVASYTAIPSNGPPIGYAVDQTNNPITVGGSLVGVNGINYVPIYNDEKDKYTEKEQLRDNLSKTLSFQLSVPIFNNWSQRATVQRAAIQTEVARLNEIQAQNTLRQTIETAYNDAYAASKTYAASVKQVNANEEAYRMVLQRFDIGAANFVEKQVAENTMFQSRSDLTRAKYNFIFKKKILDFYQGKQIEY